MSPPDSPHPPDLPSIGEGYTLTGKLGEGAFGEVFKARHELLGQEFAVKILKPELCEDQDVRDRFLDEARALIRFSHPNIVQVRHVGEHGGRLFLVMDLVNGVELSEVMRRDGAFEEERALHIIKQLLSGLEAAHAAGIVHRDLKPSNILVQEGPDGRERVSILDFGLSKFSAVDGPAGAHRSITGTIVGTLAYMSPEQIKGEPDIDGRSDLFAAGLIFLEMIQGHHPYPGESGIVVAAKLLRDPIPPIEERRASEISENTRSALARALERDRDARYSSVTMFAQALEGKGPPSDTSRVTTIQDAQAELARQEAAARRRAGAEAPRRRSPVPLVVALLLIGGAAAVFFLLSQKGDQGSAGRGTHTAERGGPAPAQPPPRVPAQPEPARPEPAQPEPAQPEPAQPEPARPEPAQPEPAAPETPGQPETPTPAAPNVQPPPPDASPDGLNEQARPLLAGGRWAEARTLFKQSMALSKLTDDAQVAGLRGAAESYVAEADQLARSGRSDQALALLGEAIAWLKGRYADYEGLPQANDVARLQLGFARTHLAEAQVESARWLALRGERDAAQAALKEAAINYDFALHQLERDGVRYWEYLIRRAQMHRLLGDSEKMMADVAYTTKTNNVEVPAHMWVAHATAARRTAQGWAARGRTAEALQWAQKAAKVAEDGASWQEDKLSRQQWLDLVRVLFVTATLRPTSDDPTALHGKIRYWVSQAGKRQPAAWLHPDVAKARLTTARAMERYLQALVFRFRKQDDQATQALDEAAQLVGEALELRKAVAAAGGLGLDGLPYEVQAAIYRAQGRSEGAEGATEAALAANRVNPD